MLRNNADAHISSLGYLWYNDARWQVAAWQAFGTTRASRALALKFPLPLLTPVTQASWQREENLRYTK